MSPSADSHDERVNEAIAAYLEAAEAGRPPEREAFLARYPDLQAELRAFLDDHARFAQAAQPIAPPAAVTPAVDLEAPTIAPGDPSPAAPLGTVRYFGDYELLEEIARGGMGVVYKARQVSLNRLVALKMILSGQFASPDDVRRFRTEAEAAANLDHPNIVPIYEVGEHEGQQYFSMKLIEGRSLAQTLASEPRASARGAPTHSLTLGAPKEAAKLVATIARAVHHAHQRGVIHRDLKPGNILLDDHDEPHVTDFGLAKRVTGDKGMTQTGAIVGTPSYMAPEQARGEKGLSVAADVYSLGAILYELLTGRPPFQASTPLDTVLELLEREPERPRVFNPRISRDLEAIVLKCLQKQPSDRYDAASALAEDLDRWQRGETTRARPPSLIGQALRWLKRNAVAVLAILCLGVACGLGYVLAVFAPLTAYFESFLYPTDIGLLNALRLLRLARQDSMIAFVLMTTLAILTLGLGWLIRLAARPRTPQMALAAGASVGLVATIVAFSIVGPILGQDSFLELQSRVHPISYPSELTRAGLTEATLTRHETEYLTRYLEASIRGDIPGYLPNLASVRQRALLTNRFYGAVSGSWDLLAALLVLLLGLAIHSAWAADHLTRHGRGILARTLCYLELYLPTAGLLITCEFVLLRKVLLGSARSDVILVGLPGLRRVLAGSAAPAVTTHFIQLILLGIGLALVGLAHCGVLRRWKPRVRVSLYLAWFVIVVLGFVLLAAFRTP